MSLFNRRKYWVTPAGSTYDLYRDMASQPHLLIAGATGSGKSVVVNGILATVLMQSPSQTRLILIDPKRVELAAYRRLPHTMIYASEPDTMVSALSSALSETDRRYQEAARKGQRRYDGSDLYVIIDELADLMTTDKRHVMPLIQRLCQIGRAAKVHVIACTQCPISAVIPTPIKVNFDSRVALRTACAQDSRNILGVTGCELLPRYGQGYYRKPEGLDLWRIPMVDDSEIDRICRWWTSKQCQK